MKKGLFAKLLPHLIAVVVFFVMALLYEMIQAGQNHIKSLFHPASLYISQALPKIANALILLALLATVFFMYRTSCKSIEV